VGLIVRLAFNDLRRRKRFAISMGLLVSLPVLWLTLMDGYVRTLDSRHRRDTELLVVQQVNTVGQLGGSRLPATVADDLRSLGVDDPVPEIHTVLGSTAADATMVVGVDPERYRELDPFPLTAGTHLRADVRERTALLGRYLADRLDAGPGDVVPIRGRNVRVVGVFDQGTIMDDAAVMPLRDAQELLGWGDDVSIFVIPAGGPLVEGDQLPGGLEVVTRGDVSLVDEWDSMIELVAWSVQLLTVGAVLVLVAGVWRLAWLQRRDLGLIRLLGFGRLGMTVRLATQVTLIVAPAAAFGIAAAGYIAPRLTRTALGVTVSPTVDLAVIGRSVVFALGVLAVSIVLPMVAFRRIDVRRLLGQDE
jgi:hypothetical protein